MLKFYIDYKKGQNYYGIKSDDQIIKNDEHPILHIPSYVIANRMKVFLMFIITYFLLSFYNSQISLFNNNLLKITSLIVCLFGNIYSAYYLLYAKHIVKRVEKLFTWNNNKLDALSIGIINTIMYYLIGMYLPIFMIILVIISLISFTFFYYEY